MNYRSVVRIRAGAAEKTPTRYSQWSARGALDAPDPVAPVLDCLVAPWATPWATPEQVAAPDNVPAAEAVRTVGAASGADDVAPREPVKTSPLLVPIIVQPRVPGWFVGGCCTPVPLRSTVGKVASLPITSKPSSATRVPLAVGLNATCSS